MSHKLLIRNLKYSSAKLCRLRSVTFKNHFDGDFEMRVLRQSIIYLAMYVCLFICMFAIGARTVGARGLKFGTEMGSHPESVFG